MFGGLPATSHGYRPPRGARVLGWECPRCGRCSEPYERPPRRWPRPCPECGEPADPTFDAPWSHEAAGYRLRHLRTSTNRAEREIAEAQLLHWEYEDAIRTGDPAVIARAHAAFHDAARRSNGQYEVSSRAMTRFRIVMTARSAGDLTFAAEVILAWYPAVDTRELADNGVRQYEARNFVQACVTFLEHPASIGHEHEAEVDREMRDVAVRAEDVLTGDQQLGMQRVMHLRATVSEISRFGVLDRSPNSLSDPTDEPPALLPGGVLRWLRPARTRGAPLSRPDRARDWQRAARAVAGAPVSEQARLATGWVAWALGTDEADLVADAYEHLIPLVPRAVAGYRDASDRDGLLRAAQEHVEEAGYWLCRARRYRAAVLALETGRAVALSIAHDPSSPGVGYDDVVTVNGDGAVVYVAAAKAGGYALIVAGGQDPQYVELPRYDRASVATLLGAMLPSPEHDRSRDLLVDSAGERIGATRSGRLAWLWRNGLDMIMLAFAGGPMVTLIPIGLLGLLPLHAAGVSRDSHAGAVSAVRYAPNVRALERCRAIAASCDSGPLSVLVADVPDGHGLGPGSHLDHARDETTAVAGLWARAGREQQVQHGCRWRDFRSRAGEFTVWHIACHGGTPPAAAPGSVGALYFADAAVDIEQLRAEIRHVPRRLAILSACDSHLTSSSLPNETIGLPAALLELGFAGVIAATWGIDDAATPYLMAYFHRTWCAGETHPAVALNRAQSWLARATRAELHALLPGMGPPAAPGERPFADPLYWAGFAYTGA